MFETYRNIRWYLLAAALCYVVLGVVMLLFPDQFVQAACYVVGVLLLAYGALGFLSGLRDHRVGIATIPMSVVAAASGIFLIAQPRLVTSILPFAFGLILLLDGLLNIRQGVGLKRFGDSAGTAALLLGVITMALGILILWHPYGTATLSFRLIGIFLTYNGISDLIILFRMRRAHKLYQDQNHHARRAIDVQAEPVREEDDE